MDHYISSIINDSDIGGFFDNMIEDNEILSYFSNQTSPIPLLLALLITLVSAGIIFRIFRGQDNLLNTTISCLFSVVFIYILAVSIYQYLPSHLESFASLLPFAFFRKDILIFMPFSNGAVSTICMEIISLTFLCFIIRISDWILCRGKSVIFLIFAKLLSLVAAAAAFFFFQYFLNTMISGLAAQYASIILLCILFGAILISLFNPLLCIILTVVNPIVGILYTFFFSSLLGKQLTSAVLCSSILCILIYVFERLGYSVWDISSSSLIWWIISGLSLFLVSFAFDTKIKRSV